MYDPEFMYCPRCNDEYRPEIEECPACEVGLIGGREMLAAKEKQRKKAAERGGELNADEELVVVRRGPLAEMKIYEELLSREGICSLLAGDESSCGKGCCGGNFDLVVRREEAHDALRIVEAEIRRTSVIDIVEDGPVTSVFDPLAAANTCPACGYGFSGGTECPDCGLCF
jgi:hypothetical protein